MFSFLLLLWTTAGFAADKTGSVSLGASAGLILEAPWASDSFRSAVSPGPRASVFGRWQHEKYTALEIGLDYFAHGDTSLAVKALRGSFIFRWMPESDLHPIFGLGFGLARAQSYFLSGNRDLPMAHLRVGVEKELTKNIDLSFVLDHFTVFRTFSTEPVLNSLSPAVSIAWNFGAPEKAVAPVEKTEKVTATSDKDSDGDGIIDSKDSCPNSPVGSQVNELGCAKMQSFDIRLDVKFRSGTAVLASDADQELSELAGLMNTHKDLKVELQGHTDTKGGAAKNKTLSKARAEAVKARLINKFSISPSRLEANGYGSSQPLVKEVDEASRAQNRRVTARVLR